MAVDATQTCGRVAAAAGSLSLLTLPVVNSALSGLDVIERNPRDATREDKDQSTQAHEVNLSVSTTDQPSFR